jgi:hypothetical protein
MKFYSLFATPHSPERTALDSLLRIFVLRRPGGSSEELEPDPIPNSAVKLLSANGTMAQALGE